MELSLTELQHNVRQLTEAINRGEIVTLVYGNKVFATVVPATGAEEGGSARTEAQQKALDTIKGMWDDMPATGEMIARARKGRFNDDT